MDKDCFIELTNKVYRQTLLFPKKEPLRYKIRETADNILSGLVEWQVWRSPNPGGFSTAGIVQKKDLIFKIEKEIELIKAYFNVVKWQNWVSYFDILKIEEEYNKINDYFKRVVEDLEIKANNSKTSQKFQQQTFKTAKKIISASNASLDKRKRKIIDILKKKQKVQVREIKEILTDVTKRTIRRDFDALLELGLVKRIGESNNTFYVLSR